MRLLDLQREHSEIISDEQGIPEAVPSQNTRFKDYAQLFSPDDQSQEASVWRLGHALFDELDLRLQGAVPYDVKDRVEVIRRKKALSDWLQSAVGASVELELRGEPGARSSQKIFTMLTGNQIERATNTAIDNGDLNLSTLLAQAGGDAAFRVDIEEQLIKWKDQVIDAHIEPSYRKIYSLLAGIVEILPASNSRDPVESCKEVRIAEGLDWKRAFGLQLWFACQMNWPVVDALRSYQSSLNEGFAPSPIPWYLESPMTSGLLWVMAGKRAENDALYDLIRLSVNPFPLEIALLPRGFSPSPLDHRIPWHLYTLLSRSLGQRDFGDRTPPSNISDKTSSTTRGSSTNANKVTASFAFQLECQGLWEYAIFVLLHLESPSE